MCLCDLVSSKIIVIPTIIFTIKREEVLILRITNMQKLLVHFHVILVNTCYSVYLFQVLGGKYIIDIFSDAIPSFYGLLPRSAMQHHLLLPNCSTWPETCKHCAEILLQQRPV